MEKHASEYIPKAISIMIQVALKNTIFLEFVVHILMTLREKYKSAIYTCLKSYLSEFPDKENDILFLYNIYWFMWKLQVCNTNDINTFERIFVNKRDSRGEGGGNQIPSLTNQFKYKENNE